ncbi:MAG: APC family permease [Reyranellaceae bacterium]
MSQGASPDAAPDGAAESGLARALSPTLLILVALGTTLGAGIYVVIGEIIGSAGYWTPVAFLVACVVALFTGTSFAELAGRNPSAGGPVAWADDAFGRRWLSVGVGWGIVAVGIASAATISTGFVAYIGAFVPLSKWWILPVVVGIPTAIAIAGVRESAIVMAVTTVAGLVGLVLVLWQAGGNIGDWPQTLALGDAGGEAGGVEGGLLLGIVIGAFLAFYAFIGFEDIVHLGEETKAAHRTVPLAIFVTLGVALVFYLLIALAAVTTLPPRELAESKVPLVAVVERTGMNGLIVGVLGLVTIADGLFAQIIMVSRTVYDLGERRRGAPRFLSALWPRTRTPALATALAGGIILALALFFPTRTLASATSAVILVVFCVANLALIRLKSRQALPKGRFRAPAVVPWLGAGSCLLLLAALPFAGGEH